MTPLVIPIAIEWVILVTTLAPVILVGRFNSRPKLGLSFWFGFLLSSGLATALAVGIAVSTVFETYAKLHQSRVGSQDWLSAILVSFSPWLILAISGIALALINQRLEPLVSVARESKPLLDAASRPRMIFQGHPVATVELPIMMAAVSRGQIIISRLALETLSEPELDAVLWHEIGHIRGRHNELKTLAGFVRVLSSWLTATQAMVFEVNRLVELDADLYALKHVDSKLLGATRKRFISS